MFFQPPSEASNNTATVPAPVGGLNARDSIIAMADTDAIFMRNWWPQPYGCTVRRGCREWATGLGGPVNTLHEWAALDGTRKLFAWSTEHMYDVSLRQPVGTPILTGLSSSTWDCTQVTNAAGNNLIAVNGQDPGIIYTNTGVSRITLGDGVVANTWKGLDPANAIQVTTHQHRLWAVQKNSSSAWFLPPDAVQGEFKKYDFGPLFSRGGNLAFLATWTLDDGAGAQDHLVGLSSNGEAVVFVGTDPEDPDKWGLRGIYFIGAPVSGREAFCKAGGDLLALTQQGVISMTSQLVSTRVSDAQSPLTSSKIQYALSEATSAFSDLHPGWDIKYFPKYNMLLVNVPTLTAEGSFQFAANQLIGSWTQFTGYAATSWGTYKFSPMYGTADGRVMEAWIDNLDNVTLGNAGGTTIIAQVQQAYSYFSQRTTQKQVGMYRPTFTATLPVAIASRIVYDFADTSLVTPDGPIKSPVGIWDLGIWNQDVWGGGTKVYQGWIQAQGVGSAVSLRMATQTGGETLWVATDYSLVNGWGLV